MTNRTQLRAARGFTLLEVMASGALLLIGMSAILSAILSTRATITHQAHQTQALHVVEAEMEGLLVRSAASPDLDPGAHAGRTFNEVAQVQAGGIYTTSWVIGPGPIARTRTVTVTATWDESGTPRSLQLTTIRN